MSADAPKARTPAQSLVRLHQLMSPSHTNFHGHVHGGVIMRMVDETGAISAMRHCQRPVVTVAIDSMTFHSPVQVGEVLGCTAAVTYVGRTSIEVGVRVVAENPVSGELTHTNSAHLVYVALGEDGKPAPVPGLRPETEEQRQEAEAGKERQRARLARGTPLPRRDG